MPAVSDDEVTESNILAGNLGNTKTDCYRRRQQSVQNRSVRCQCSSGRQLESGGCVL